MPKNLSALIRYRTIDESLRRVPKRCTWEYLANVCADALYELEGIENIPSERTIRGDIQKMKSGILGYKAPIINVREEPHAAGYYRYTNPDLSVCLENLCILYSISRGSLFLKKQQPS